MSSSVLPFMRRRSSIPELSQKTQGSMFGQHPSLLVEWWYKCVFENRRSGNDVSSSFKAAQTRHPKTKRHLFLSFSLNPSTPVLLKGPWFHFLRGPSGSVGFLWGCYGFLRSLGVHAPTKKNNLSGKPIEPIPARALARWLSRLGTRRQVVCRACRDW